MEKRFDTDEYNIDMNTGGEVIMEIDELIYQCARPILSSEGERVYFGQDLTPDQEQKQLTAKLKLQEIDREKNKRRRL